MLFCEKCQNMYYIKIHDENNDLLVNYCKQCGFVDKNNIQNTIDDTSKVEELDIINEYTKYDCRLPRVNNIPCPNNDCISNKNNDIITDTILIKSNEQTLSFIYLCTHCNHCWKLK